jgi:CRP/FNR family transcriptional regulator, cyclic AMP receptor protein
MTATEGRANSKDLLRAVPSLERLSEPDLERIAAVLAERTVAAGSILVEEGATGQHSFLIVEGDACVVTGGVTVARVGPGEFVGELALLTDRPRCATVRAETAMCLLVLDRATLASLIDPVSEALLGTLARRLRREADLNDSDARGRWVIGAPVAVRSRYDDTWVEGFEIAEVDLTGDAPRLQLRRRSDEAVLPLFFTADQVRRA